MGGSNMSSWAVGILHCQAEAGNVTLITLTGWVKNVFKCIFLLCLGLKRRKRRKRRKQHKIVCRKCSEYTVLSTTGFFIQPAFHACRSFLRYTVAARLPTDYFLQLPVILLRSIAHNFKKKIGLLLDPWHQRCKCRHTYMIRETGIVLKGRGVMLLFTVQSVSSRGDRGDRGDCRSTAYVNTF
jgi:hypothetical protein